MTPFLHNVGVRIAFLILLSSSAALVAVSCSSPTGTSEPREIVERSPEFSIAWDCSVAPSGGCRSSIDRYRVYYRGLGTDTWRLLASVDSDDPLQVRISRDVLEPGQYEFAVRSIDALGRKSAYHRSTDRSAEPSTGWYLNWLPL